MQSLAWIVYTALRALLVGLFFALVLALMMYAGLYWSAFGAIAAGVHY